MTIADDVFQRYLQAGNIAADVREAVKKIVQEGMPIIDVCEKTEALIREKGGQPAFPCNVSINEIAAHYSSPPQDKRRIPDGSLVKIDIGVHIDGFIADTAITVCFDPEKENLVYAAEAALEKAIEILRPGLPVSQFGLEIQKTIQSRGFKPVKNLTGHQVNRFLIHAGQSLPNVHHFSTTKIKEGEVYGVEPFVTTIDAAGTVTSGLETCIFRLLKRRKMMNPYARNLLNHIRVNYRTLPFSERWLQGIVSHDHYTAAFLRLLSSKCLMSYPVFIESSGKLVAQAEHTVIIVKDGCLVTTK